MKEVCIEKEAITSLQVSSILYLFIVLMIVPIVITTILFVLVTGASPMAASIEELSNNVEQVLLFNIVLALFTAPILWDANNRDSSIFMIGEVHSIDFLKYFLLAITICISYSVIGSHLEIEENPILSAFDSSIASMILSFITVCLLAPVIEELVYRGVLFSLLNKLRFNDTLLILVSTLLFTAVHSHYDTADLTFVFVVGVLLGYARFKTKGVLVPIAIHFTANLYGYILVVLV